MTYREAIETGTRILQKENIADAKIDAWYLLQMACKIDRNFYYLHEEDELTAEQQSEYESTVHKRAEHVPLQYIIGEQEFMGLKFKVNSNVLIPRQDTETLVEEALRIAKPGMRVLDLCTGSGCIIISLAKNVADISCTGSDISKQALLVAKAKANEVEVEWERSDLFENISGTFDLIVSNPPYIPTGEIPGLMPEVRDFEPVDALDGKEDGLYFYRIITEKSPEYLTSDGYLYFEIGYDQGEAVSAMMRQCGYTQVEVIKDLAGNDRVVKGRKKEHV